MKAKGKAGAELNVFTVDDARPAKPAPGFCPACGKQTLAREAYSAATYFRCSSCKRNWQVMRRFFPCSTCRTRTVPDEGDTCATCVKEKLSP